MFLEIFQGEKVLFSTLKLDFLLFFKLFLLIFTHSHYLRIFLSIYGALEWIRTTDLPLRRRLLYPAELRRQVCYYQRCGLIIQAKIWLIISLALL